MAWMWHHKNGFLADYCSWLERPIDTHQVTNLLRMVCKFRLETGSADYAKCNDLYFLQYFRNNVNSNNSN